MYNEAILYVDCWYCMTTTDILFEVHYEVHELRYCFRVWLTYYLTGCARLFIKFYIVFASETQVIVVIHVRNM